MGGPGLSLGGSLIIQPERALGDRLQQISPFLRLTLSRVTRPEQENNHQQNTRPDTVLTAAEVLVGSNAQNDDRCNSGGVDGEFHADFYDRPGGKVTEPSPRDRGVGRAALQC